MTTDQPPLCPSVHLDELFPAHCRRTWPRGRGPKRHTHVCHQPRHPYDARGSRHKGTAEPCVCKCGRIRRSSTNTPIPVPGPHQQRLATDHRAPGPATFTSHTRKGGG